MVSVKFRYMDRADWYPNESTGRVEFEVYQIDDQNQVIQTVKASVSRSFLEELYGIDEDVDLMDAAKRYANVLQEEARRRVVLGKLGDIGGMEVRLLESKEEAPDGAGAGGV